MTGDTASLNQQYFNKLASAYDSRFERTIDQLGAEIRNRKNFIGVDWVTDDGDDGKSVRLLDYACGTGLVSRALAEYTTQIIGVDVSENMVTEYNTRAENQGLSNDEMHAYQGNLINKADPTPEVFNDPKFSDFDVAAVGLGFHHFDDAEFAAKQLVSRLRPDGVLFILDFFTHAPADSGHSHSHSHAHDHSHNGEGHGHGHSHNHGEGALAGSHQHNAGPGSAITHHGFSQEQVKSVFENAGAGKDFALEELGSGVVFHGHGPSDTKRRVFLARGTKA